MFNTSPYLYNPTMYNPGLTAQQRAAQLEQQYAAQRTNVLPVSSQEEAKAYIVSMDGTPTFFYNAGKNEIYLKRTNRETGAADFQIFALTQAPQTDEKAPSNVNTYEKNFKALNDKIDGLYSLLAKPETVEEEIPEKPIKGGKNVK